MPPCRVGFRVEGFATLQASKPGAASPQTVYVEMEVDAEMQRGLLPGALALSGKLWPAVQTVVRRTAASAQGWLAEVGPAHQRQREVWLCFREREA